MIKFYEAFKNYAKAADEFGCAESTVYYAVNPDKYEKHKAHVYEIRNR